LHGWGSPPDLSCWQKINAETWFFEQNTALRPLILSKNPGLFSQEWVNPEKFFLIQKMLFP